MLTRTALPYVGVNLPSPRFSLRPSKLFQRIVKSTSSPPAVQWPVAVGSAGDATTTNDRCSRAHALRTRKTIMTLLLLFLLLWRFNTERNTLHTAAVGVFVRLVGTHKAHISEKLTYWMRDTENLETTDFSY